MTEAEEKLKRLSSPKHDRDRAKVAVYTMQGRTVIAIAHRLSTIAHLDRLIVLQNGAVVEDGSHAELLARGGLYARLWQRQSGSFLVEDETAMAEDID